MAPIRHQPRHTRQVVKQSIHDAGPYPVTPAKIRAPALPTELARLSLGVPGAFFARDFQFTNDQVARWIIPKGKAPRNFDMCAYFGASLKKSQGAFQLAMFERQALSNI